jgi:hypothetical protein
LGANDRTARGPKRLWKFSPPPPNPTERAKAQAMEVTEDDMKAFIKGAELKK